MGCQPFQASEEIIYHDWCSHASGRWVPSNRWHRQIPTRISVVLIQLDQLLAFILCRHCRLSDSLPSLRQLTRSHSKVPSAAWIHLAAGPMTGAQSHAFSGAPLRAPRFRTAAEMSLRRKYL
ncbi:LOW QUALITY PROTEIN: hypothetical protein CH63R_11904 [Colletotrichum higginsianum IMI 349063]|uniref:Uncharacterized protein n=1 Tax=Colletotrichum higginsianum (strain IMI 349063) TaxID=759273 RepID=A0A1B7XZN6_COLHI|nr:LOW QUALITY PROTEIN: hypothetical protein CH63R_11904 [Colletotrichum higginsianum IMI 349063]OBR05201.1 LOW QUALITY PROTEIN: hypothetical protein CH63R_11904 [Colletotrichum higginsianum IMI 349063]